MMKNMEQTMIEAGRFYTIVSASGSVIEAVESADNGADIRLGHYGHHPAQEWAFDRVGEGVYRIRNRANGKLMDLMMAGTTNGTWLHLWEDVSGTSQMWTVEPNAQGEVRLRSQWAGGRCVDTVGMGCPTGAILQVWQETAAEDQLWRIQEVKDQAADAQAAPAAAVEETVAPIAEAVQAEPVAPAKKKTTRSASKSTTKTAAKTTAKSTTKKATAKTAAKKTAAKADAPAEAAGEAETTAAAPKKCATRKRTTKKTTE